MKRSGFQKPLMVVVVSAIAFVNFGFFKGITEATKKATGLLESTTGIKCETGSSSNTGSKKAAYTAAELDEFCKRHNVDPSTIQSGDVRLDVKYNKALSKFTRELVWTEQGNARKEALLELARKNEIEKVKKEERDYILEHLEEFAKTEGVDPKTINVDDVELDKSSYSKRLVWTKQAVERIQMSKSRERMSRFASKFTDKQLGSSDCPSCLSHALHLAEEANKILEAVRTLQSKENESIIAKCNDSDAPKTVLSTSSALMVEITNYYFTAGNYVKVPWFIMSEDGTKIVINGNAIKEGISKAVQACEIYDKMSRLETMLTRNYDSTMHHELLGKINKVELDKAMEFIAKARKEEEARAQAEKVRIQAQKIIASMSKKDKFPMLSVQPNPQDFMKDIKSGVSRKWLENYLVVKGIEHKKGNSEQIKAFYPEGRSVEFNFYSNVLISVWIEFRTTIGFMGRINSPVSLEAFTDKYTNMLGSAAVVTKRLSKIELSDSIGDTVSYGRVAKVWIESENLSVFTRYPVSGLVTLPDDLARRVKNPFMDNLKKVCEIEAYVKKSITKEREASYFTGDYGIEGIWLTDRKLSEYEEEEKTRRKAEEKKKREEAQKAKEAAALEF